MTLGELFWSPRADRPNPCQPTEPAIIRIFSEMRPRCRAGSHGAAETAQRPVVVGARGLTGMDAHFLGSVSRQIINFAACPITVVH